MSRPTGSGAICNGVAYSTCQSWEIISRFQTINGQRSEADVRLRFKGRTRPYALGVPPGDGGVVGLVAVCDFVDPWGNTFGLYQVLFSGSEPPRLSGYNRDQRTEVEERLAAGLSASPD